MNYYANRAFSGAFAKLREATIKGSVPNIVPLPKSVPSTIDAGDF